MASKFYIWDLFCESVAKDLPLFLVGDYNCDALSNSRNYFKKILNRLNLENVVFEDTNFTTETGTCCIDLCITNRKKLINSVNVLTLVCSTHAPVLAEISFKTFNQHSFKREIRKYDAADIEGLADQLNITNWDNLVTAGTFES